MILYYAVPSCSEACFITAFIGGLSEIQTVKVDLDTHTTLSGTDFFTINPRGSVPVLILDDGTFLSETSSILQFLADKCPSSADLAPPNGTIDRYRLQDLLNFIASELHAPFIPVFHSDSPDVRAWGLARVAQRCGHAESTLLGDGRDFLLGGGGPSVADLYLYVVMSWSPLCGFDLAPYPSLRALLGRVKRLPVVLAAEARMAENPPRV